MGNECLHCDQIKEIYNTKRQLCKSCYQYLRKHELLNKYPSEYNRLFIPTLIKKYGEEIFTDFNKVVSDYNIGLVDIGNKYGFTRERARQIFELIYGFKYTVIVNSGSEQRKNDKKKERILRKDQREKVKRYKQGGAASKGAETEKKVFDICSLLGYEIKPYTEDISIDLIVNGFLVEIKSAYKTTFTTPGGKTPLYHFYVKDSQLKADFVVCHAVPLNTFFVIPRKDFSKGNIYIPEKESSTWMLHATYQKTTHSKWYAYKEAWHLLKPKQEEVVFVRSQASQEATIAAQAASLPVVEPSARPALHDRSAAAAVPPA